MAYIELDSYKYMQPAEQDQRAIRRARNAKAISDFTTFLTGLGAMYVGILAVRNMDVWRPHVEHALSAIGLS